MNARGDKNMLEHNVSVACYAAGARALRLLPDLLLKDSRKFQTVIKLSKKTCYDAGTVSGEVFSSQIVNIEILSR